MARLVARLSRLAGDHRGLALIEFALGLPIMLLILMYLLEVANYAIVRQQISQLALQVADNASRVGLNSALRNKPVSESQINDLFTGADIQGGKLDIANNARIVLSSLEVNKNNGQWIHWQRCFGSLNFSSSYGTEGTGRHGQSFSGMGPDDGRVVATERNPVMFVEIGFRYLPLVSDRWAPATQFAEIAALIVRDDRDTTQLYNDEGVRASTCS